jgi:NAD(P) transhydrogenase subunit beta
MLLAIVVTLIDRRIVGFEVIIAGLIIGGAIGAILAVKIEMTSMPQLVALFNGFGGGASVLVAGAALIESGMFGGSVNLQLTIATVASGIIGAVTFWGSLVAFGKLQEVISGNAIRFAGQRAVNAILGLIAIGLGVWIVMNPTVLPAYWGLVGVASVLGILLVIPIGGADMPVVIALLNSYSGLAAASTGFVLSNNVLIIAGSLVGASGLILTNIMCKAMNRSLTNVLFGTLGPTESTAAADDVYAGKVKASSPEEVAMLFDTARRVAIVPGYGMAVAQAQHAVRDMANLLESRGVEVEYAIHPVAGRMPGHMNVLLAEANVEYDKLKEMDEINPTMAQVDVAIVIGANDVVNPVARTDPSSPIAGMPIIDVDKARTVVVVKRSLSPGFAGIPNPLFAMDNTLMMFGDGKKAILELVSALKEG